MSLLSFKVSLFYLVLNQIALYHFFYYYYYFYIGKHTSLKYTIILFWNKHDESISDQQGILHNKSHIHTSLSMDQL